MKTTVGEAVRAKAWRAELRALNVERRPPPSRPDRGYVEQPEERSEPSRRRVVIPLAELERAELEALAEELGESLDEPQKPLPALAAPPLAQQPEPPSALPLPLPESAEVPKKKPRKSTEASGHSDDYKRAAVAEYLAQKGRRGAQQEAAKKAGISGPAFWLWVKKFGGDVKPSANGTGRKAPKERVLHTPEVITGAVARVLAGPKGTQARVAAELGVNPGTVSLWVQAHKAKHGMTLPGEARALASNGAAPHVPVSSALPPVPALVGLEKYIKALVAQQVAIEVRRRLRGMVG